MGYKVISGKYEAGTNEQQIGFENLFGKENIQEKFDLYFHWYNIVHEIGHCIIDSQKISIDKVDEELFVNCFAVAYWRFVDKGNNLKKVQCMIENILKGMPSPMPKGVTFSDFFKSIWGSEEMNTVMMYGYFQLSCVVEAFKSNKSLKDLLEQLGYKNIDMTLIKTYYETINSENAKKVVDECIKNLNNIGAKNIDIDIELVDNPETQCCQPV